MFGVQQDLILPPKNSQLVRWKYHEEEAQNAVKSLKAGALFNLGGSRVTSDEGLSGSSLKGEIALGWFSLTLPHPQPHKAS